MEKERYYAVLRNGKVVLAVEAFNASEAAHLVEAFLPCHSITYQQWVMGGCQVEREEDWITRAVIIDMTDEDSDHNYYVLQDNSLVLETDDYYEAIEKATEIANGESISLHCMEG